MTILYSDTEGITQSLVLFLPFYMLMRAIYTSLFPGLFRRSKSLSHTSHGGTPPDLHSSTHSLLHLCKQALREMGIPEKGDVGSKGLSQLRHTGHSGVGSWGDLQPSGRQEEGSGFLDFCCTGQLDIIGKGNVATWVWYTYSVSDASTQVAFSSRNVADAPIGRPILLVVTHPQQNPLLGSAGCMVSFEVTVSVT